MFLEMFIGVLVKTLQYSQGIVQDLLFPQMLETAKTLFLFGYIGVHRWRVYVNRLRNNHWMLVGVASPTMRDDDKSYADVSNYGCSSFGNFPYPSR